MTAHETTPVVDFSAHFYAPMLEARRPEHESINEFAGAPICTDIDALRDRYTAAGVDFAVLSQPYHIGSADTETVSEANDALLDLIESYDDLFGLAALPVAAGGEPSADEFERALERGYHGAAIETRSDNIELIDAELEPVFEVADRTESPVLVHPKLHESLGPDVLDDHWRHNAIFGREVALAASVSKAIHEGIYDRYPNLRLVFHHNGGNIASMLGRIEGSLDRAHRRGADHLKRYEEFERQLATRVYVDTAGCYGDEGQLRASLESLPASNVLFGTDFPYEVVHPERFQNIIGSLEELRGGKEREAVLGGNALDLLVNVD